MGKLPISLVIITLNEEKHIARCVRSVPFASEIIIVDSFSTDKTVEIATSLGARVIQEKWRGYGPQKSFASGLAKYDWILSLDADEALSADLAKEIAEIFTTLEPQVGYLLPRMSYFLGRWIRYGGWYPDYQLRLYNRQYSKWPEQLIHERVQAIAEKKLRSPILHYVFENISDQVQTNDKYSTLQAQQLFKIKKAFSIMRLLTKPPTKFIETYFWKMGFMDGLPGFIISMSAAYSVFLKFAKLWELENKSEWKE